MYYIAADNTPAQCYTSHLLSTSPTYQRSKGILKLFRKTRKILTPLESGYLVFQISLHDAGVCLHFGILETIYRLMEYHLKQTTDRVYVALRQGHLLRPCRQKPFWCNLSFLFCNSVKMGDFHHRPFYT